MDEGGEWPEAEFLSDFSAHLIKDMDLDLDHFFNFEQLITGWFKDTKVSIF